MIWNALTLEGTLLYGQGTPPPVNEEIIGVWDEHGVAIHPPNIDAYTGIRPLGNNNGQATPGNLLFHYVMGHAPRQLGDPLSTDPIERLYPEEKRPIAIEIRHKLFTGNVNPEWDGWGWRAEIIGNALYRDPSARAIGIYSDAACTIYLYTTGAMTQQTSEWQLDQNNEPLTVWATEYNPGLLGYNNDEKHDVHHACLFGSIKEGYATLHANDTSVYHEFWQHDQGYVPPPEAQWVDTGATVTGQAGQLYYISDPAVVALMVVGEDIRLGAQDTKFNGIWSGTNNLIQINPYITVTVGDHLWRYI